MQNIEERIDKLWPQIYLEVTGSRKSIKAMKGLFGLNGIFESYFEAKAGYAPGVKRIQHNIDKVEDMLVRNFDTARIARYYNVRISDVNCFFKDRYKCTARKRGMYLRIFADFDKIRQMVIEGISVSKILKSYDVDSTVLNNAFRQKTGTDVRHYAIDERAKRMQGSCRLVSARDSRRKPEMRKYRAVFSGAKFLPDEDA